MSADLERALAHALEREQPRQGFADALMAKVRERERRRKPGARQWLAIAAAILIAALLIGNLQIERERRHEEQARRAGQQIQLALRITQAKLRVVQAKVRRRSHGV